MAHEIYEHDNLFSVREMPWHGLGTVVQDAPNSEEAIKLAGLDWTVEQKPVMFQSNDEVYPIPGAFSNVRMDKMIHLGFVTERYKIVQNSEAFAFTDDLLGFGAVYETAGSLQNGKRIWLCAKLLNSAQIDKDQIDFYLIFTHGHDGKNSIKVAISPVRVVCNNTLNASLKGAQRTWNTVHMGEMSGKMKMASEILSLSGEYRNHFLYQSSKLLNKKISFSTVEEWLEQLFPLKKDLSPRKQENVLADRKEIARIYNLTDDLQNIKGSAWGFVNAVSDFVWHREPKRMTDTFAQARMLKVMNGNEILDKAYELAA